MIRSMDYGAKKKVPPSHNISESHSNINLTSMFICRRFHTIVRRKTGLYYYYKNINIPIQRRIIINSISFFINERNETMKRKHIESTTTTTTTTTTNTTTATTPVLRRSRRVKKPVCVTNISNSTSSNSNNRNSKTNNNNAASTATTHRSTNIVKKDILVKKKINSKSKVSTNTPKNVIMNDRRPSWVPKNCIIAGIPHWMNEKEESTKDKEEEDFDDDIVDTNNKDKKKIQQKHKKSTSSSSLSLPKRRKDGTLIFLDYPKFRPNLTPEQVLRAGAFGGTYFRSITSKVTNQKYKVGVHLEFPSSWYDGLNVKEMITSSTYRPSNNKYNVKSGNDLNFWESKGWMKYQDPYGWFQWYCRFYLGRRTYDDDRQIQRWVNAIGPKGRWRTFLIGQCIKSNKEWDDITASPVTRQTLLHWGYQLTQNDFNKIAPPILKGKSVIYLGKVV